ncbi:glucose oxidase [Aspergillus japonicus CBS 114.51]|uniref:glucose oxidase n=1 Tax=Aspergillus japonicus CBS 114.51 TaxID=1448312 RepID=A0A8T8XA84_ASPJA|nr:glucose oxidase [Aspergillus japonicus CBS 114.51]RAH84981.1 glucose oxidase [Aspergillus japonicus CBS 114.51]
MHYLLALPLITALAVTNAAAATRYDYIIVGGGTAGLTVANRLSEDPAVSVLVIEPGQIELNNPNVTIITRLAYTYDSPLDWAYQTTEQKFGNRCQMMRTGRALGGTSVINGAAYICTEHAQIDALQALGNTNWTWDNLFPYYLKSKKVRPPNRMQSAAGASIIPKYHRKNGRVQVGFMNITPHDDDDKGFNLNTALNRTLDSLGTSWNRDLNTGSIRGNAMHPYTVDAQGVRNDAAKAYYEGAKRGNLHVMLNVDLSSCRGVEINEGLVSRVVQARREVVLAAGAMRSAGNLELSGIGNPQILQKHGIPIQIDLPSVGENLQDQLNTSFVVSTKLPIIGTRTVAFVSASDLFGSSTESISASLLASIPQYAEVTANQTSGAMTKEALQLLFTSQHDLFFNRGIPFGEFVFILDNPHQIHVGYWGLLPFSRGNVHISSSNVACSPTLNLNYGLLNWDIQGQIAMSKFLRRVFQTEELEHLDPPNYHAVGSTTMLPREMGGVLDSRFNVYGTRNVRVLDSSILPVQLCGHPTANIYAIVEWAADMIKEDRLFSDMGRTVV